MFDDVCFTLDTLWKVACETFQGNATGDTDAFCDGLHRSG